MGGITIDGSFGEGGGQILRMSLVFSTITGKPFRIVNIRGGRPKPGLRRQHVGCVKLAAQMSEAEVTELQVGASELSFKPGKLKTGTFYTDIGAGSITLLGSVFLPIASAAGGVCHLHAKGGTDVPFAPTSSYFKYAFLPLVSGLFTRVEYRVTERGYFPGGKGEATLSVEGNAAPAYFSFLDKGDLKGTSLYIVSTNLPGHISKRLYSSFVKEMEMTSREFSGDIEFNVENTISPDRWRVGVSACSVSKFDKGMIARSQCGMKNVPAERIGKKMARDHMKQIEQPCVDSYLADQLLPYLALSGGEICVIEPSQHFLTGLLVSEKFLGNDYSLKKNGGVHRYSFQPWVK